MRLVRYFDTKTIQVIVDPLFGTLANYPISNPPLVLNFRIWELIFSLGSIMTDRFEPTLREKFTDFDHLLDKIDLGTDFQIHITRIRTELDSEKLGDISKTIGVGIAALVVQKLFETSLSSIGRVRGAALRLDFEGATGRNQTIGFEAKGSSSQSTLNSLISHGKKQKDTSTSNIRAVIGTLIREGQCSVVEIWDPPGGEEEIDYNKLYAQKSLSLSSLFNFLGHKELSNYFLLMSKRILNDGYEDIVTEKEFLYQKIQRDYQDFEFKNSIFKGTVTRFSESYIFTGIAANAVGFYDFLREDNWQNSEDFSEDKAIVYQGKILVKELSPAEVLRFHDVAEDYYQKITYTDFVRSSTIAGRNLLLDMLFKAGFKITFYKRNTFLIDLNKGRRDFILYKKFYFKSGVRFEKEFEEIDKLKKNLDIKKLILLTPSAIPKMSHKDIEVFQGEEFRFVIEDLKAFFLNRQNR